MDANTTKEKRHRMSDHSHHHTKPTSEEVYQDAKRILEEYLKRKLKDTEPRPSKYGRSESYKAASRAAEGEDERQEDLHGSQNGIGRSKTMPSSFKVEKDGHIQNKSIKGTKKVSHVYSSPDTDLDEPHDDSSPQRQKKSFFKRATERLMHAFHRDNRSGEDDVYVYESKTNKRKKIKRKSKNKELRDSPDMNTRHEKDTHVHIDTYISTGDRRVKGDTLDIPDDKSSHHDSHSSSSRRNSAGKRFFDSIRKSFRKVKKGDIPESKSAELVDTSERERSYSRSISTPDRNLAEEGGQGGHRSRSSSKTQEPKEKKANGSKHGDSAGQRKTKSRTDILVSQSTDHSAPRTIQVHGAHIDKGLFPNMVPQRGVIESSVEIDRKCVTIADDGLWECNVTMHSHQRTRFVTQTSIEIDGSTDLHDEMDDVDSPTDAPADKDEAIDKIVKKLIEIGDNLSSESESHRSQEAEGAVGGAPGRGDGKLSSLEQQILECLREGGDRMSHNIDEHATEFIDGAVRQTVYQKFCSTLRQSVGDDVNWNQMALVFHATKSALKVAGVGSKKANELKDLTLKYVMERCASWIVDQGGWESIVSDSDSELD
ncbi:splicing regulatory glutamine/lysine-rich protein 1-like isoform X1 [Haliotis cracherodii]|uniref:splicing regulatory glutamine/lysine-rich protein 1-like isoform X1 n=2 Tax=Haliotis cracherodii TaxID=6455 RepID=UPI0039E89B23